MHSSAFGTTDRMLRRSFSNAARLSLPSAARYSSIVFGLLFTISLAHSEDMSIGVPHMHFPHAPWHVGWRPCDVEALIQTSLMNRIDIIHTHRHPNAFVTDLIATRTERHPGTAFAASALPALAQKYFALAGANAAKCWGTSPVPALGPSQLFEPFEALLDIGNVQYRCQSLRIHFVDSPIRQYRSRRIFR